MIGGFEYPPRLKLRGYDSPSVPGGLTQEEIREGKPLVRAEELVDSWIPANPRDVIMHLTLDIGWDDNPGTNLFYTTIYTHDALLRLRQTPKAKIYVRRSIVVHEFHWPKIKKSILNIIARCERETEAESIKLLMKHFHWEFE